MNLKNLFLDIIDDLISCRNRAEGLIFKSEFHKKFLIAGAGIVLSVIILRSHSQEFFYIQIIKLLLICFITFLIFVQSDTFWFLTKKALMYHLQIRIRKNIRSWLKTKKKTDMPEMKDNIGQILITTYTWTTGYKKELNRIGFEIGLLLMILYFFAPLFFVFNISLFLSMFLYISFFNNASAYQIYWEMLILARCVENEYKSDKENCRKFILENRSQSVRDLETIYSVIKNSKN